MPKFRKKPVVIDAFQLVKGADWPDWMVERISSITKNEDGTISIATLEGVMLASVGDWIIKGVEGELYPCKPDIFEKTYEAADVATH